LSNWIGSLELESAGDALVTWGESYRERAIRALDEWQLKSPLLPAELVEPPYDRSLFDELVLGRMEWDLGDLVEASDNYYPPTRQSVSTVAAVSKSTALELAQLQAAIDVAHREDIELWGEAIAVKLNECGSLPLLELQRAVEMPLVQVWLALLLNGFGVEQRGDFYDPRGVWVVPQD
jgi:hypothetical protein